MGRSGHINTLLPFLVEQGISVPEKWWEAWTNAENTPEAVTAGFWDLFLW
jgi:hypothetical protein